MPQALGILTSRVNKYKASIEYEIIPSTKGLNTTIATDLSYSNDVDRIIFQDGELPFVFLSALHILKFSFSNRFGFFVASDLQVTNKVKLQNKIDEKNVDDEVKQIIDSMKEIEKNAKFIRYNKPVQLNPEFFISISSFMGGITFAKKVYSLQVITTLVRDNNISTIMLPLSTSFFHYYFKPENLLGFLAFQDMSYGVLVAKSLEKDDINNIITSIMKSVDMYYSALERVKTKILGEGEEEE